MAHSSPVPQWAMLASGTGELRQWAERMAGAKAAWEREAGARLLSEVLPGLEEREREEERRVRKQMRMQSNLGLGGAYWAESKGRRVGRVDYAFQGFENQIQDAIRRAEGSGEGGGEGRGGGEGEGEGDGGWE